MTILGEHTVDETRQQILQIEFDIDRTTPMLDHLTASVDNAHLVEDWDDFVENRWKTAHDRALNIILGLKLAQPLVPESALASGKAFDIVTAATTKTPDFEGLTGLIARMSAASGVPFDWRGHPVPSGFDPDLAAYQAVDAKVKSLEATGRALDKLAPAAGAGILSTLLASKTAWIVAGGAALWFGGPPLIRALKTKKE